MQLPLLERLGRVFHKHNVGFGLFTVIFDDFNWFAVHLLLPFMSNLSALEVIYFHSHKFTGEKFTYKAKHSISALKMTFETLFVSAESKEAWTIWNARCLQYPLETQRLYWIKEAYAFKKNCYKISKIYYVRLQQLPNSVERTPIYQLLKYINILMTLWQSIGLHFSLKKKFNASVINALMAHFECNKCIRNFLI